MMGIVVTEDAVEAAARTFFPALLAGDKAPVSEAIRRDLRVALNAALPHFVETGLQPFADSPEVNEQRLRDEAFERGVLIGREEAASEHVGPNDYQQWRDALDFAVRRLGNEGDREELLDLAEWFWEKLDDGSFGAPFKPMTGCEECGSQSGSHMGGCSKLGRF